tara:strand:+ start:17 stop:1000 length:984 start_codon:yes stop_codon:yes gene_type:complete
MTTLNITVTGAAGNISYALLPRLGELLLDMDTSISLRLLEIDSALSVLSGVEMELIDCAYPFIKEIICTSDAAVAFKDTHYAVLIGARPRGPGMERSDLLKVNAAIFQDQGRVINEVASRDVKVLVVGNPCNANAMIAMRHAPDLPKTAFYAMTMLDQHRACAQLASKIGVSCDMIENMCVWGNHSASMFADFYNASSGGESIVDLVNDIKWLEGDFVDMIAQRGAKVIEARGASSAASAANAIIDTLIMLIDADQDQGVFSLAICSNGEYGATPGTIVSYPCYYNEQGVLTVVEGIEHNGFAKEKLQATFKELADEAQLIEDLGLV